MKSVPPEALGQLAEREVKFKGSSGKAISAQHRAETYEPVTSLHGCPASCRFRAYIKSTNTRENKSIHGADYKSILFFLSSISCLDGRLQLS